MTNGNTRVVLIKGGEMETSSEYIMETGRHSPTDSSEDSVEVKVEVITGRSKRKLSEPRRINESLGPLKKRMCIRTDETEPFRPWNTPNLATTKLFHTPTAEWNSPPATKHFHTPPPTEESNSSPPNLTSNPFHTPPTSEEPHRYFRPPSPINPTPVDLIIRTKEPEEVVQIKQEIDLRVPIHPAHTSTYDETETTLSNSLTAFPKLESRKEQRNYKNMTRERRIEANARERTRVHTISAAFDTLRKSVPAYSHSQKLSKLSVLRIACSYIMTLSNMLDDSPEVTDNVEAVSRTIQREGKLRKKKEDDE